MPYYLIDDWRGGLDLRRMSAVASPTTLRVLDGGHINEGGEIERHKAFVEIENVVNTVGLVSANNQLYVFGTGPSPLLAGSSLVYQDLDPGVAGVTITAIEDFDLFDGLIYLIAVGSDNNLYHFYDAALVPDGRGRHIKTFDSKIYSVEGKNVHFSAVGDPNDWTSATSGTINLSTEDADSLDLEGLEIYYDQLAFFSESTIQLWDMDPDPLQNRKVQVLRAAGTRAGRSARQYGSGDILYLDASGVRSLRARDSSNSASVSDIGSPIDKVLRQLSIDDPVAFANAQAAVEQGTGRFWLAAGDCIYVLSHFPGPGVTAWSCYQMGQPIDRIVEHRSSIAVRTQDNNVLLYGGAKYDQYDDTPVVVETPFIHMALPATDKHFEGIDVAALNVWRIEVNYNPERPDRPVLEENWQPVGIFDGVTYTRTRNALEGYSTHAAFRMTCTEPGEAIMANLVLHYTDGDTS